MENAMTHLTFTPVNFSKNSAVENLRTLFAVSTEECNEIGYIFEADTEVHGLLGKTHEEPRWGYTVDLASVKKKVDCRFHSQKQAVHALLAEIHTIQELGLTL